LCSINCNPNYELWLIWFARYLVTYSPHADDHPSDMKRLIIWDVRTGIEKRNFSSDGPAIWPIFRWSQDDRFFARIGTDVLSVYETPVCIHRFIACVEWDAVSIYSTHIYVCSRSLTVSFDAAFDALRAVLSSRVQCLWYYKIVSCYFKHTVKLVYWAETRVQGMAPIFNP
jgi:hypothetical protein